MPAPFPFASHHPEVQLQETTDDVLLHDLQQRSSMLQDLGGLPKWPHQQLPDTPNSLSDKQVEALREQYAAKDGQTGVEEDGPTRRPVPSLPRPQTFQRQESERRERLLEVPPAPIERRAASADRRGGPIESDAVQLPSQPIDNSHVRSTSAKDDEGGSSQPTAGETASSGPIGPNIARFLSNFSSVDRPDVPEGEIVPISDDRETETKQNALQEECERRWILNLSMHFRDESNREKYFVTYAETPTKLRRLTVSLDYRRAPPGSLEEDLSTLSYQRDKNFRIYEAIHEALPDIQFYPTMTNLKLQTTPEDGQLHIHVHEDMNEIIQYPDISRFEHVHSPRVRESEIEFISHLSGFVYKVRVHGSVVIKKEIPGPDSIDEFLYEVNALDALLESDHVVQLEGLITDESDSIVKGLLIAFAPKGALVDILYDSRGTPDLAWHRREKWAKQIVEGLSDIHEAGYVQGDFTLSNIVIDDDDNAKIIDINRRGCPVGWEPPELSRLIDSGQRISMCISVKTDLFQLGMVLWALAEEVDDPERVERPLPTDLDGIPSYFRDMIETCLHDRPQGRSSAKVLRRQFLRNAGLPSASHSPPDAPLPTVPVPSSSPAASHRADKTYINPDLAITIDDVHAHRSSRRSGTHLAHLPPSYDPNQVTYVLGAAATSHGPSNPGSTSYRPGSSDSWPHPSTRGRSYGHDGGSRRRSPGRSLSSTTSLSGDYCHVERPRRQPCRSRECSADERREAAARGRGGAKLRFDDDDGNSRSPSPSSPRRLAARPERVTSLHATEDGDGGALVSDGLLHMDSGFDEHMPSEVEEGADDEDE